jgi:hypothetical protein
MDVEVVDVAPIDDAMADEDVAIVATISSKGGRMLRDGFSVIVSL